MDVDEGSDQMLDLRGCWVPRHGRFVICTQISRSGPCTLYGTYDNLFRRSCPRSG